jgi:hypothetical protein
MPKITQLLVTLTLIRSLAAFSAGWLWNISPQANFLTAFGFGVIGPLLRYFWRGC